MPTYTKNTGTGADEGGALAWSNPTNIQGASNGSVAQVSLPSALDISNYLKATGFGFAIPSTEIVVAIEADIRVRSNGNWLKDYHVYLLKAGSTAGSDYADTSTVWPTTLTHEFYGDQVSDLWGTTWTPADINDANFGLHIQCKNWGSSSYVGQIDSITITVTTTFPHVDVSDSGHGVEGSIAPRLLIGEVGSGSELFGKAFSASDLGHGVEATNIGYTLAFGVADLGSGLDRSDLTTPPAPPQPFSIQDLNLPQVQLARKISGSQFSLLPLPNRDSQYVRQISKVGDVWEFTGFIDRATLDRLFALSDNGLVWFRDPVYGNFHAVLEVEATWVVGDDAPQLETSP